MATEANTSIKPYIIGLLSAGNEEKVSHENSQGFSPLWLTAGDKKRHFFFQFDNRPGTDNVTAQKHSLVITYSCWLPFSIGNICLIFLTKSRSHKKKIASILSFDTCTVILQWPQKQVPASKE